MPVFALFLFHFITACDFVGEKLAYFLGITSPKYQYAINEYNRLMEEVSVVCPTK